jgi:uncharacterized protein (TIGR04255 family)
MANFPILSKPPIREALIDIKYNYGDVFDENLFSAIIESTKSTHPIVQKQFQVESSLGIKNEVVERSAATSKQIGMLFKNSAQDSVVQYRINGYTFNKIKKYDGWDSFVNSAIQYWSLLTNSISEIIPQRIGLRYINSLPLAKQANLDDYIRNCPKVPFSNAPILGMFSRISFKVDDILGNYTIAIENPNGKDVNLILDIDLYVTLVNKITTQEIIELLGNMREQKNNIFFSALTERKLEEFK